MIKPQRTKTVGKVKANHDANLNAIAASSQAQGVRERFKTLSRKLQTFLRKDEGSMNALKAVPNLARLMFGLQEDSKRFGLPPYSFDLEKMEINQSIIAALEARLRNNYVGYGAKPGGVSCGETFLNCFVDVFITFTVLKTPKEMGAKPPLLVNPGTGSILELDIVFEDFLLAFEFQGHPTHYSDPKVQAKDSFKLAKYRVLRRILVPVNECQLQSRTLLSLIANSMKDQLGLHEVLALRDSMRFVAGAALPHQLLQFCKAIQRLYLADQVFREVLDWLDAKAVKYLPTPRLISSISATTPAPRQGPVNPDLDLARIYQGLRYVKDVRRNA